MNSTSIESIEPGASHTAERSVRTNVTFRHWLMIPLSLLGVLMLFVIQDSLGLLAPFTVFWHPELDRQLRYQLAALVWASLFVALTYLLYRDGFRRFFRRGEIGAPASPVRWLISDGKNWLEVGRTWALILSLGTATFMLIGVISQGGIRAGNAPLLLLVLPLAASNAFVEEVITRYAIVAALWNRLPNTAIYLISALVFGIPHYFGIPGGPIGVIMAGFLGWLLARSVVDTQGMFWAWFLHFLQDVVIFTAMILLMVA